MEDHCSLQDGNTPAGLFAGFLSVQSFSQFSLICSGFVDMECEHWFYKSVDYPLVMSSIGRTIWGYLD